jgi:hypothetical protein
MEEGTDREGNQPLPLPSCPEPQGHSLNVGWTAELRQVSAMAADPGDLSEGEGTMMFSLREIAEDQFIYRCHGCGWESEPMTTEEAIAYPRTHVCHPKVSPEAIADTRRSRPQA